jgi:hypothetical protein
MAYDKNQDGHKRPQLGVKMSAAVELATRKGEKMRNKG